MYFWRHLAMKNSSKKSKYIFFRYEKLVRMQNLGVRVRLNFENFAHVRACDPKIRRNSHSGFNVLFFVKVNSFRNENDKMNAHFITISGHIFAYCMFIFHKTEVQTVILMCWMGQNSNWFKRYGQKCKYFPSTDLANLQVINGCSTTI